MVKGLGSFLAVWRVASQASPWLLEIFKVVLVVRFTRDAQMRGKGALLLSAERSAEGLCSSRRRSRRHRGRSLSHSIKPYFWVWALATSNRNFQVLLVLITI